MRNLINAQIANVIVDRQDRVDVAGIEVRGLPAYPSASAASAASPCACLPGCKSGTAHGRGKRLHRSHLLGMQTAMQERLTQGWRSSRRFTSRRFATAIG